MEFIFSTIITSNKNHYIINHISEALFSYMYPSIVSCNKYECMLMKDSPTKQLQLGHHIAVILISRGR